MNADIQRLRAQIGDDRAALGRQLDRLEGLSPAARDPGIEAQTAVALHHAYAAIEAILERCMLALEGSRPTGPDSHRALLEAAPLTIANIRPPLLSRESVAQLHDLRGFLHFMHHRYGIDFDGARLQVLRDLALALRPQLEADLDALDAHLSEVATAG